MDKFSPRRDEGNSPYAHAEMRGDEVSAHGQAGMPLAARQSADANGQHRPGRGLALGAYCVEAGITSTAAGAWASSGFSGSLRAAVWIGVTAALAVAAAWLAEPAVTAMSRCLRGKRG
jgi:hypothetical protein